MKKIALALVLLGIVIGATYFHFFGLVLKIENKSTSIDVGKIECRSKAGKVWDLGRVNHAETLRKLMFLNNGDVLECDFAVDGIGQESSVVVGYFSERIDRIDAVLDETPTGVVIGIFDSSKGKEKIDELTFRTK